MILKLIAAVATIGVALGLNWAAYAGTRTADTAWAQRSDALDWSLFERIERRGDAWLVPDELRALDGTRQRLVGALFPLPQLTQADGSALAAVLAPPAKFGCCALSCDPRPNLQVLAEFAVAQRLDGPQRVIAEGVLRLHLGDDGGWSLASLEGALIELLAQGAQPEARSPQLEARSPQLEARSPRAARP